MYFIVNKTIQKTVIIIIELIYFDLKFDAQQLNHKILKINYLGIYFTIILFCFGGKRRRVYCIKNIIYYLDYLCVPPICKNVCKRPCITYLMI